MKKIHITFYIMLILYFVSCSSTMTKSTVMDPYDWILGTWEYGIHSTLRYEAWTLKDDSTFRGINYDIYEGDTIISETMLLAKRGDKLIFEATVTNQNEGRPIHFESISIDPKKLTFENSNHDFPTRVNYFKDEDFIKAWVEGKVNGDPKKIEALMSKVETDEM